MSELVAFLDAVAAAHHELYRLTGLTLGGPVTIRLPTQFMICADALLREQNMYDMSAPGSRGPLMRNRPSSLLHWHGVTIELMEWRE